MKFCFRKIANSIHYQCKGIGRLCRTTVCTTIPCTTWREKGSFLQLLSSMQRGLDTYSPPQSTITTLTHAFSKPCHQSTRVHAAELHYEAMPSYCHCIALPLSSYKHAKLRACMYDIESNFILLSQLYQVHTQSPFSNF